MSDFPELWHGGGIHHPPGPLPEFFLNPDKLRSNGMALCRVDNEVWTNGGKVPPELWGIKSEQQVCSEGQAIDWIKRITRNFTDICDRGASFFSECHSGIVQKWTGIGWLEEEG